MRWVSDDDVVIFGESVEDDGVGHVSGADINGGDNGFVVAVAVHDGGVGFVGVDEW